jgi:hypothetical protein
MSLSRRTVFTDEELDSNDGMLTSIWGPPLWHVLHTISFNYPKHPTAEQKRHYREFINNLQHILPCGKCRTNLPNNLKVVPLTDYALRSRRQFSRWMYRLHEQINTMLGKTSGLSYEDVAQRYENFRARCIEAPKPETMPICKYRQGESASAMEAGCVVPITGIRSKCIVSIVPKEVEYPSFIMDDACYMSRDTDH